MKLNWWRIVFLLLALGGLAGCTAVKASSDAENGAIPVVTTADSNAVLAEGSMEAASRVVLRFEGSGTVATVGVKEGDVVVAGQFLASLDDGYLKLAVQQADASLAAAQAQLAQLKAGAKPEDIAVIQAQLDAAKTAVVSAQAQRDLVSAGGIEANIAAADASLAAAKSQLAQLKTGAKPEEIAVYEAQVAAAKEAVTSARTQRDLAKAGSVDASVAAAQAQLSKAQADAWDAKDIYDRLGWQLGDGATTKWHAAQAGVEAAQSALDSAQASGPIQLKAADVAVQAAQAQQQVAEAQLALAQSAATPEQLAAAEAAVTQAEASLANAKASGPVQLKAADVAVQAALAQQQVAQAQLDAAKSPATTAQLAAAQAAVAQAEAAAANAKLALDRSSLFAPFGGTITQFSVKPGELASPGQVVAVLAATDALQVRTTDLTELDVVSVQIGQQAVVTLDAMPGREFLGHVTEIGQEGVDYRGDVTYPVTVVLDEFAPEMRIGMTALVKIQK